MILVEVRMAAENNPSRKLRILQSTKYKVKLLSHVRLFVMPQTIAYQAPPSMEFSRQVYWSGLPFSSPGDLPNPGIEPGSPTLQADALPSEPPGKLADGDYSHEIKGHCSLEEKL